VTTEHDLRVGADGTLRIVETFGPTIQGEGPNVGRAAVFLRLAGCNLTCTWCDTAFSWDPTRPDPERPARNVNVTNVLATLDRRSATEESAAPAVTHLVITGGEPLLQARNLANLASGLRTLGWSIEVETSGTVSPGPLVGLVDRFNVSPKLRNSEVAERARLRPQVLREFAALPEAAFKFVVEKVADLSEVAELVADLGLADSRVFVMAQGTTGEEVLRRSRELVEEVAARGWGLTPRWHTLLWADERGR
jgi:7-carboxy-7-deazaguanine synthase